MNAIYTGIFMEAVLLLLRAVHIVVFASAELETAALVDRK